MRKTLEFPSLGLSPASKVCGEVGDGFALVGGWTFDAWTGCVLLACLRNGDCIYGKKLLPCQPLQEGFNPQRAGLLCVCVCVCVSVKSHLSSSWS